MTEPTPTVAAAAGEGQHLILYDGVCGLCDRLVQFVLARDRHARFDFAPLQSDVGRSSVVRMGGDPDALTSFYVVADYRTGQARTLAKGTAAVFVAHALGWPWRAAVVLRLLPVVVLDWGYDLVARYRYRIFGRFDQCALPRPEQRKRFVDVA